MGASVRGNAVAAELLPAPNGAAEILRLTVDDTAGGVQFAALHANTEKVLVQIIGADVYVTFDGSEPSSTNGFFLLDGYFEQWSREAAVAAKFIRADATNAVASGGQFVS